MARERQRDAKNRSGVIRLHADGSAMPVHHDAVRDVQAKPDTRALRVKSVYFDV